jgi:hypothetical protein
MTKPILLWFRLDLRLVDNPALAAAATPPSPSRHAEKMAVASDEEMIRDRDGGGDDALAHLILCEQFKLVLHPCHENCAILARRVENSGTVSTCHVSAPAQLDAMHSSLATIIAPNRNYCDIPND